MLNCVFASSRVAVVLLTLTSAAGCGDGGGGSAAGPVEDGGVEPQPPAPPIRDAAVADADAGQLSPATENCNANGWCEAAPPIGQPGWVEGDAAWGLSLTDIWMVGRGEPSVHRWNGQSWTAESIPGRRAVHGTGEHDVWVAGGPGHAWQKTAAGWTSPWPGETRPEEQVGTFRSIFSIDAQEAWLVGYNDVRREPTALHVKSGGIERLVPVRGASAVWGTGASDVWIGGFGIEHYDGATLTPATVPDLAADELVTAFCGTSRADVWAGTRRGQVFHYDGATWKREVTRQMQPTPVNACTPDGRGGVLLATDGGLFRYTDFLADINLTSAMLDPRLVGVGVSRDGAQWAAAASGAIYVLR